MVHAITCTSSCDSSPSSLTVTNYNSFVASAHVLIVYHHSHQGAHVLTCTPSHRWRRSCVGARADTSTYYDHLLAPGQRHGRRHSGTCIVLTIRQTPRS